MTPLDIVLLVTAGVVCGYVGHELVHYAVLRPAGYHGRLSLWPPYAAVRCPEPIPPAVRVAAVAPAVVGGALLVAGWFGALWAWLFAVGAAVRLCWLSPADRQLARGVVPE